MKHIYLFFIIFLLSASVASSQYNVLDNSATVLINEEIEFSVTSFFPPAVKSRSDEGTINIEPAGNNTFSVIYIPEPDYIGSIEFVLECNPVAFPPAPEYVSFNLQYVKSYVNAKNDYIWYTGDTLTFSPIANDSSSLDLLTLRSISQVVHGNATISNNEIIYTGVEDIKMDYIVYNVIDTNGVYDVATAYISYPQTELEDYYEKEVVVSLNDEYSITLDAQDYALASIPNNGILTEEASHAYVYKSENIAVDTITFVSGTRERAYIIHTVDRNKDEGIVKDDLFFGAINTVQTFNVFENDESSQFFIEDYSDDLTYLGDGLFTYEPGINEQGLRYFYYTVNTGSNIETGSIQLILNNFYPENGFTYNLHTKQNSELVLDYDVPINTYYFNLASTPNFGTVEIFDQGDIALTCNTLKSNNSIVYTPLNGFVGVDEFDIEYCPSTSGDCAIVKIRVHVEDASEGCPCINDCVWAGDANNDGIVSMLDILTIGQNIGAAGVERSGEIAWTGTYAEDFEDVLPLDRNSKYADANGDGTIGIADIEVVKNNIGKYHRLISHDALGVVGVPFYYSSTTTPVGEFRKVKLDFYLGSESYPVVDMEGVAFELNFDAEDIDSSSVKLFIDEEDYFISDAPYIAELLQPEAGNIQVGIIKTNRVASSGFGKIATLEFIIEDEAIGIKPSIRSEAKKTIEFEVLNAMIVNKDGLIYDLKGSVSTIRLDEETNDQLRTLYVSPNPATSHVTIVANTELDNVCIYDMSGREIISSINNHLDISKLSSGIYIVKATSDGIIMTHKLSVVK